MFPYAWPLERSGPLGRRLEAWGNATPLASENESAARVALLRMGRRRTCPVFLSLLALFLLGTVVVLSTVSFYLSIEPIAYLTEDELANTLNHNDSRQERIPRILHQTWRTETLEDRWQTVSQHCRDLMPDYQHILWTDASSREFIASNYSWFLPTFDAYTYPIQRADAIRYFVLHQYGGVYLDLDIGCIKRLDPLLVYPVILPRTIPVGVSNDLIFAEKGHPFMEQTIHNLRSFDRSYVLNYPTVMFSTGPMFLSAQYGIYTTAHPGPPGVPGEIRILPKSLYGKNAKPAEVPNSFFEHYYGSSWHADDAAFITFLGKWGKIIMWIGLFILLVGFFRALALWVIGMRRKGGAASSSGWQRRLPYHILLPRSYQRSGNFQLDFSQFSMSVSDSASTTRAPTPISSEPSTPTGRTRLPILPLTFEVRSPSPSGSSASSAEHQPVAPGVSAFHVMRRAGAWAWTFIGGTEDSSHARSRSRSSRRNRGVMFFLPAFFAPTSSAAMTFQDDAEMLPKHGPRRAASRDHSSPSADKLNGRMRQPSDNARRPSPSLEQQSTNAPPPYDSTHLDSASSDWTGNWEEWSHGATSPP